MNGTDTRQHDIFVSRQNVKERDTHIFWKSCRIQPIWWRLRNGPWVWRLRLWLTDSLHCRNPKPIKSDVLYGMTNLLKFSSKTLQTNRTSWILQETTSWRSWSVFVPVLLLEQYNDLEMDKSNARVSCHRFFIQHTLKALSCLFLILAYFCINQTMNLYEIAVFS